MKQKSIILCWLTLLTFLSGCASVKQTSPDVQTKVPEEMLSLQEQRRFDYYFLCALNLKAKEEYDAAFEMLEHCLEINPQSPAVFYELSQFYLFLKKKDKVQLMLEKAVATEPDNFWYRQTLASVYRENNQLDKAIAEYESMYDSHPSRTELLMVLIELYGYNQQYDKAISALDRLEMKEGKNEQISMQKFRMYLALQDNESAFAEMQKLADEYPFDLRYLILLGDLYLNNGNQQKAYETYQEVLQKEPDNPLAQLSLASYYEKSGQDSLFHSQLDTLVLNSKLEPKTCVSIMQQLIIEGEQSKRDSTELIALFEKLLERPQENADLALLYAQYLMHKKESEENITRVLFRVLEIEPENSPAQLQLLQYAINRESYDEIINLATKAIQYNPDMIQLYYFLGFSYFKKERTDEALKTFQEGVDQKKEDSDLRLISDMYTLIGDLYHDKEDEAAAFMAYDSALVYFPDNVLVLNNYAYYLSLKNEQLDRAEEMSYKTIQAEPQNSTYLDTYAWILFVKGRYSEAKLYIDSCLQNEGSENAVEVEHAGDIYFMNGDVNQAVDYWKKSLELGNESKTLKKKIKLRKYVAE